MKGCSNQNIDASLRSLLIYILIIFGITSVVTTGFCCYWSIQATIIFKNQLPRYRDQLRQGSQNRNSVRRANVDEIANIMNILNENDNDEIIEEDDDDENNDIERRQSARRLETENSQDAINFSSSGSSSSSDDEDQNLNLRHRINMV